MSNILLSYIVQALASQADDKVRVLWVLANIA